MKPGRLGAALLILSGCSVSSYDIGEPLPFQSQSEVPAAGASLGEVLAALGPPLRMSAMGQGYALAWEYWQIKENKLGLSLRPIGAEFLSIDWGNADTQGEFLLLRFDASHRLTDTTLLRWDRDLGGGQGVQPFFSFVSVVDVDDLTKPLPTHRWGASSWQELPRALNREQRMDSGTGGLEQRGTTAAVGQHSLEMR